MPEDLVTDPRLITLYMSMKEEIEDEIDDERFNRYWHGRPMGTNKGCRGPLCRMAQRNRVRPANNQNASIVRDTLIAVLHEVIKRERAELADADKEVQRDKPPEPPSGQAQSVQAKEEQDTVA